MHFLTIESSEGASILTRTENQLEILNLFNIDTFCVVPQKRRTCARLFCLLSAQPRTSPHSLLPPLLASFPQPERPLTVVSSLGHLGNDEEHLLGTAFESIADCLMELVGIGGLTFERRAGGRWR